MRTAVDYRPLVARTQLQAMLTDATCSGQPRSLAVLSDSRDVLNMTFNASSHRHLVNVDEATSEQRERMRAVPYATKSLSDLGVRPGDAMVCKLREMIRFYMVQ